MDFARALADSPHISEILDRELSEKHAEWRQEWWKENRDSVAAHTEALVAQELDSPLRTAVSTEAAGLLELVYPGLKRISRCQRVLRKDSRNDGSGKRLATVWPAILAALLDSLRADRAVDWSKEQQGREWNQESPLYGRWSTRSKNGWTASADLLETMMLIADGTSCNCGSGLRRRCRYGDAVPWVPSSALLAPPSINCMKVRPRSRSHGFDASCTRWPEGNPTKPFKSCSTSFACGRPFNSIAARAIGTLWARAILGWAPLRGCLANFMR